MRSRLSRGTAYSKLEKGDSAGASEGQQDQASGLGRESRGQPAKRGGGPEQRGDLQFVLNTVESHLRDFILVC